MRRLRYKFGLKFSWWRRWMRFCGNRTFVKRDSDGNLVGFVYIKGPDSATSLVAQELMHQRWTEET